MVAANIALTGGIASGKTTVAEVFSTLGAQVIDLDEIAHQVTSSGSVGLKRLRDIFGSTICTPSGDLDRVAMAQIVFGDDKALRMLNEITHPLIFARLDEIISHMPAEAIAMTAVPLLVETGSVDRFDRVIVVDVDENIQMERLMKRSHLTCDQARSRIEAQATRQQRLAIADYVIDNTDSDRTRLIAQIDWIWKELCALYRGKK